MVKKGEVIENPITKERVTFLDTNASTNNELLRMETFNLADGYNRVYHIHPSQVERHRVLGGSMGVTVAGKDMLLHAGDSVVFEKNVPHKFWNGDTSATLHFITEFRPAFNTEGFIETYIALARDGKFADDGFPHLLQFFVMLSDFPIAGFAAGPPIWLQKLVIGIGALLGRMRGYVGTATYRP